MAGPLIPYLTYQRFLETATTNKHERALALSAQRFVGGIAVTVVYVIGSLYWPMGYLQSEQFLESSFFWKITDLAIVTKIYMYKYILVWLLSEASCIATGITHQGLSYFEYCNVNLVLFETATSFTVVIKSYNITTNRFSFKYIYRRLKFLGNAYLSQVITILFLAVWHGLESGYFVAFSNEFLQIYFEKHVSRWWAQSKVRQHLKSEHSALIGWIFGKLFVFYFLGYAFAPFMFLYVELWWPILRSMYFYGHISLGLYFLLSLVWPKRTMAAAAENKSKDD